MTRAVALPLLRVYGALRGAAAVEAMLGWIDGRFAYSGWPYYERPWTNLHMSRLTARLRHQYRGVTPPPPRRAARQPIKRIACVGSFVGLLGFPKDLMAGCPVELVVADIVFNGQRAAYLADGAAGYDAFDLSVPGELDRLAAFINSAEPDLVMNIGYKYYAFELIDRLDAPCIANYCAGSDLLHHPRVDIQYHGQPEADYFVRDHRMFCGTTESDFSDQRVQTITGYIDPRGLLNERPRPWSDRAPLIVCHGSLYKFASESFLQSVWSWLRDDTALQLVLMGRDSDGALDAIRRSASDAGVAGRVEYRGQFSAVRDASGDVSSSGWFELVELLGSARLAPNPFPFGGGSSRFEAYALGAPSPHLGVRLDRDAWGRPQPSICDIPALAVPAGTAWTIAEYRELGRRCLADGAFADRLAEQQLERARVLADVQRWWQEIVRGYDEWHGANRRT